MQIGEHLYLVGSEQFGLSHPLDCNCYLVDCGSALALIDAGVGLGVDDILLNITRAGFDPSRLTHILVTHSHMGHWGGANGLRAQTGARVYAPAAAAWRMADTANEPGIQNNLQFKRYPPGFVPRPCQPDETFEDGDRVQIGNLEFRMVLTQGHTRDSTCIFFEDNGKRGLFSGDVVFYSGKIGLLNLEGCSLEDYRRDIHKLADLQVDMLLPGHSVFMLKNGQKHIRRAIFRLSDLMLPESYFEQNEFAWDREYLRLMTEPEQTTTR